MAEQIQKIVGVQSSGKYGAVLFYLDTFVTFWSNEGKIRARWENYKLWAVFYLLIYCFVTYFMIATLVWATAFLFIGNPLFFSLRSYFGNDWLPVAILALVFSIFPFSKTWPTIMQQLRNNKREVEIRKEEIVFKENGTERILPKSETRIVYSAADLVGGIPFKVVTFCFESEGVRVPFYRVVMKLSLKKNEDYRHERCDEFAGTVAAEFGLKT